MTTNIILTMTLIILAAFDIALWKKGDEKYSAKLSKLEMFLATIYFFAGTLLFLYLTGIISSGFHLIDDTDTYIWLRSGGGRTIWKLDASTTARYEGAI